MKYKYDQDTGIVTGRQDKAIGSMGNHGYLRSVIDGKTRTLHRYIFKLMGVDVPDGMFVDHINHIRTDNRWSNLRLVTKGDNTKNKTISSNNTSGVTGVSWHKQRKRWAAHISIDDTKKHLGMFVDFSKAVDARKNAEVLYGYHDNHGKDVA